MAEALGTELAKVLELQEDGRTLLVKAGVGWKPGVGGQTDPPTYIAGTLTTTRDTVS